MSKNTRWSPDDLKKKGLVQNEKGDYVKVETLVAKWKIEKIVPGIHDVFNNDRIVVQIDKLKGRPTTLTMQPLPLEIEDIEPIRQEIIDNFNKIWFLPFAGDFTLPNGERITVQHRFDIAPKPAPRMSRSDQWKTDPYHPDPKKRQRPVITRYFAWRDAFRAMSAEKGFTLGEKLKVVFIFPVPAYLSKAKRAARMGQYHRQKPDYDNCCKSIGDAFHIDDGHICDVRAVKMWGEKAEIIIF